MFGLSLEFPRLELSKHNSGLRTFFFAGSFKSQLIDYFRGCIVSWEKAEGSIWQFYDN